MSHIKFWPTCRSSPTWEPPLHGSVPIMLWGLATASWLSRTFFRGTQTRSRPAWSQVTSTTRWVYGSCKKVSLATVKISFSAGWQRCFHTLSSSVLQAVCYGEGHRSRQQRLVKQTCMTDVFNTAATMDFSFYVKITLLNRVKDCAFLIIDFSHWQWW